VSPAAAERQGTARYLQALAQHWPFIAGSVVIALAAAIAFLALADRRYEAHADLLVAPLPADDSTFVGLPVLREIGEGRSVLTAARLVETPEVAEAARRRLGLSTREGLLDAISVAPQEQSNIVTVEATADSPARAAAIANAFALAVRVERTRVFQAELRQVVGRLTRRLAQLPPSARDVGEARALGDRLGALRGLLGSSDPTLQITSRAVPPTSPSWPRPVLSLAVALLLGLVLGVGVAIALELLNPLVLRDEDVLDEGLPLLARAPRLSTQDLRARLADGAAAGDVNDAFRLARVNLTASGRNPETILVTSPARGEGKTSASANLALAYVQAGARVVLVDADLRRAGLTALLEPAGRRPGLVELVRQEALVDDVLVSVPGHGDRLQFVAAATSDESAIDLLQSDAIEAVVDDLQASADVIVFDVPPLTEVADALPLSRSVDAVVLVVRYGRTRRDALVHAQRLLGQLGVVASGVIAVTRRRSGVSQRAATPLESHGRPGKSRRRAGSPARSA
jgi:receptor protein-tyrosine kinase